MLSRESDIIRFDVADHFRNDLEIFDDNGDITFRRYIEKTNYSNFSSPCLREELLCKLADPVRDCCHKVTIIGSGMVGVAIANSLLFQVQTVLHILSNKNYAFRSFQLYRLFRIGMKVRILCECS